MWQGLAGQDVLVRNVRDVYGEAGGRWLADLPDVLDEVARRWSVTPGEPFGGLTYNYVAAATTPDGSPAVLKLGPGREELAREVAALRATAGHGAVRVLEFDEASSAALLERAVPGTPLADVDDVDAMATATAGVMRELWVDPPPGHSFASLEDWLRAFDRYERAFGGDGPLPSGLLHRAKSLAREMTRGTPHRLIHGDLHQGNILAAGHAPWLAIDPKGVVAPPPFEVAPFLLNLERDYASPHVLERCLHIFAGETGYAFSELRDWSVPRLVLAALWSVEDHGTGWERAIACAQAVAGLRP